MFIVSEMTENPTAKYEILVLCEPVFGRASVVVSVAPKAWFPYRCICRICRVCRTKKIHRTDITLWKPPVQMLNTKETTDTTFCTRWNEFYLSYECFSYDRHHRYDRYNHMETRLKARFRTTKRNKDSNI